MKPQKTSFLKLILACYLAIAVVGCATKTLKEEPVETKSAEVLQTEQLLSQGQYQEAAELFQLLAQQNQSPLREHYLTRAADAYIRNGDVFTAIQIAETIDSSLLAPQERYQIQLLNSQIDISMGNPEKALERLDQIPFSELDPGFQINYRKMRANAYSIMGNLLESARERVFLSKLLFNEASIENNESAILEGLNLLTNQALEELQPSAPDELGGWMALVRLLRLSGNQGETELAFETWRELFPDHPADIKSLRDRLATQRPIIERPDSIAILLPQSGNHARAALAIHKGIVSAYYQNTDAPQPALRLYDTESTDITTLYQAAVADGAQLVIGPLSKKRLRQLTQSEALSIPVIALNQLETTEASLPNLYQFGLSPEDEVEQSAASAWLDGHRTALILSPSSNFGHRLASHFADYWKSLGGEVLEAQSYPPKESDFSAPIKQLLNLDSSKFRYKKIRQLLNLDIKFEPRRRQDADFLFLTANRRNARLIRPQLQFFRASRLPVFATSHIYSGKNNPSQDIDLNGITFSDIPWLDEKQSADTSTLEMAKQSWGAVPSNQLRLFAFGFDAYSVIPDLGRLQLTPGAFYSGYTGNLFLDKQNKLHRQLNIYHFKKGSAKFRQTAPLLKPPATQNEFPVYEQATGLIE